MSWRILSLLDRGQHSPSAFLVVTQQSPLKEGMLEALLPHQHAPMRFFFFGRKSKSGRKWAAWRMSALAGKMWPLTGWTAAAPLGANAINYRWSSAVTETPEGDVVITDHTWTERSLLGLFFSSHSGSGSKREHTQQNVSLTCVFKTQSQLMANTCCVAGRLWVWGRCLLCSYSYAARVSSCACKRPTSVWHNMKSFLWDSRCLRLRRRGSIHKQWEMYPWTDTRSLKVFAFEVYPSRDLLTAEENFYENLFVFGWSNSSFIIISVSGRNIK